MSILRWAARAWNNLTRRTDVERDLREEMEASVDLAADEKIAGGLSPADARRAATVEFGGVGQVSERIRDVRAGAFIGSVLQDLRYGCRMLARNPGFTSVAVLSLAIGVGANTAVFSFADTILLRPLTVPRAGEVLTVGSQDPLGGSLSASYREFADLRDRSRSFAGLVASATAVVVFDDRAGTAPSIRMGSLVSANFFRVLDVRPRLGRDFRDDEGVVPGRDAVVVLGYDFWAQALGADPAVVGRSVRLNGIEFTVIGVASEGFAGLAQFSRYDFYAPVMMWPRLIGNPAVRPLDARDFRNVMIKGRLKPGVTMSQARAELTLIGESFERAYPDTNKNRRMAVRTEVQNRLANGPPIATLVSMLTLLAGAVLFVACANVAGLLTSRAPARAREIALRLAIGAGRGRLVRQLVTESLCLALAGGVLSLAVGYAAVMIFRQIRLPTDLPIVVSFVLDRRALAVSLGVALVSAVLFGLAPAVTATRADLTAVMKASDAAGFGRRRWGRELLVAGQVAVSVILLVVATYIYRGFTWQIAAGPGFRTDHRLVMGFDPSLMRYDDAQARQFFERLVDGARTTAGVKSAALTRYLPLDGGPPFVTLMPEGVQLPPGRDTVTSPSSVVDEHYFETMGLPLIDGRGFLPTDTAGGPGVAVVNEYFARHYWPGQRAIGKRFRIGGAHGPWVEIVGIAKASKITFLIERPIECVYLPYRQRPLDTMFLIAETAGDPSIVVTPLREVVRSLDAGMPVGSVRTMEEHVRMRSVVVLAVVSELVGGMGLMGLSLAIVGLYALVTYAAIRRTKEIGIRMAIGAGQWEVRRMVLKGGFGLATAGLAIGLVASLGAVRALGLAFPGGPHGDGRTDVAALAMVATGVFAATLLAAYLPARRASLISPTDALRCE